MIFEHFNTSLNILWAQNQQQLHAESSSVTLHYFSYDETRATFMYSTEAKQVGLTLNDTPTRNTKMRLRSH